MSKAWWAPLALFIPSVAFGDVVGRVIDSTSGDPIAGARVSLQASAIETVSSSAGEFTLDAEGAGIVIVAAKKGFFNGSVTATTTAGAATVEIELDAVPANPDPDHELRVPWSCAMMCHAEQYELWESSPMAKSGQNTWVFDLYDGSGTQGGIGGFVYKRDSALAVRSPESDCAACHQPALWLSAPGSALEPLSSNPSDFVLHGVSCDLCHKIADVDESKINAPGLYEGVVRLSRPAAGTEVQYGVLGDTSFQRASQMRPAYNPDLSSLACGACHQDKNDPDLDGEYDEPNGVVSEPTYFEWRSSPYGDPSSPQHKSCAECHMLPLGSPEACSVLGGTLSRPATDVRSHEIVGTTPYFLEHAVSLTASVSPSVGKLTVEVTIRNDQTGHSVPTGMSIRNLILLVEARVGDLELELSEGPRVDDLGGVGPPSQGNYAGLPGKLFARAHEDADGNAPVFFTEAAGVAWDTRIPALGEDVTRYVFDAPAGGDADVSVRLIYRRAWRALTAAKAWTQDGLGQPLADVTPPHFGHLMEHAELTATITGSIVDAGVGSDVDSGSGPRDAGASPDASTTGPEPTDGESCGCSASRSHRGLPLLSLLMLVLVLRRRPK